MKKFSKIFTNPFVIIFLVLLIDQILKFWIKTHMYIGQEHKIFGNWFIIHFTENNGMAFGFELEGKYGKLFLSLFRLVAIIVIAIYLVKQYMKKVHKGYLVCLALIFAGAAGNMFDCMFYGMMFNDSMFQVAQFLPKDGGYSTFLFGKVVDMLYFPVIEAHYPSWFPFWGGEELIFFRPVFNIADTSISTGVIAILVFQKKFFKAEAEVENTTVTEEANKDNTL